MTDPLRAPRASRPPTAATWQRMETLLAVVDGGSLRAAAEALHVTPPAVSAAIRALEADLGVDLFTRSGRGIVPTAAAETFADYCRTMLGLLAEAGEATRSADAARLRLGAVATASETVVPTLLASYVRACPEVEVSLAVHPRDELFDALRHHEVDVVIAGRPPRGSGLASRGRRPNELVVVAAGGTASAPDARTATWVLRGHGSGTRETTRSLLTRLDLDPRTLTVGTQGAAIASVRAGLGVTLVHRDAVAADLAAGTLVLVPLPGTPLDRPWHLTTTSRLTGAARRFIAHVGDPEAVGVAAFHLPGRPRG